MNAVIKVSITQIKSQLKLTWIEPLSSPQLAKPCTPKTIRKTTTNVVKRFATCKTMYAQNDINNNRKRSKRFPPYELWGRD